MRGWILLLTTAALAPAGAFAQQSWFVLGRAEQSLSVIAETLYPYRAQLVRTTTEALGRLPELTVTQVARLNEGSAGRVLGLLALEPFLASAQTEYLDLVVLPQLRQSLADLKGRYGFRNPGELPDFPRVRELALWIFQAGVQAARPFVSDPVRQRQLAHWNALTGQALAALPDERPTRALLDALGSEDGAELMSELSGSPRTVGIVSLIGVVSTYLKAVTR